MVLLLDPVPAPPATPNHFSELRHDRHSAGLMLTRQGRAQRLKAAFASEKRAISGASERAVYNATCDIRLAAHCIGEFATWVDYQSLTQG